MYLVGGKINDKCEENLNMIIPGIESFYYKERTGVDSLKRILVFHSERSATNCTKTWNSSRTQSSQFVEVQIHRNYSEYNKYSIQIR